MDTYLQMANKPLAMDRTRNTRDLGGYASTWGRKTAPSRFLRSDALTDLTSHDIALLESHGVDLVIDLRMPSEVDTTPDTGWATANYVNIPLFDDIPQLVEEHHGDVSLQGMYQSILDQKQDRVLQVFQQLLTSRGCVLFHCTNGKDRTGVIAMLLLRLACVPDDMVVADYSVSAFYLRQRFAAMVAALTKLGRSVPQDMLKSQPDTMVSTLSHLDTVYGGSEGYLKHIGLGKEDISWIKDRLLGA